jgi:hypothetical protein
VGEQCGLPTNIAATGNRYIVHADEKFDRVSRTRIGDPRLRQIFFDRQTRFFPNSTPMKTTIRLFLFVPAFVCVSVFPKAQAVVPPPDGCYPNFTTAEGCNALQNLTTGAGNTAVGWFSLFSDTTASFNTGVGAGTLALNMGDNNTATGTAALFLNTTGFSNTAVGSTAMLHNNAGNNNTGIGAGALTSNTTGNSNTAIGVGALGGNIDGGGNTATGTLALSANNGALNTATGLAALQSNTNGDNNTAMGAGALNFNTIGDENTAFGHQALQNNIGGDGNTASGVSALFSNTDGDFNTAIGFNALHINTAGNNNIALGFSAGSTITGDNNIDIGSTGVGGESGTIRIGQLGSQTRTFIAGIRGVTTGNANAIPVLIDSAGQLGTVSSSQRFKHDIKGMDKTSEGILALKPVTFHYKSDKTNLPQFGLIAEDVAAVNPDLVVRDENGEIYTVRYDAVNAMLLNEFLKEHRKNKEQEATIALQQKQIDALTVGLQKVSAQLKASHSAPQVVTNDR